MQNNKIPVCFEVKLLSPNPTSSISFTQKLTAASGNVTKFYRYATYTGALNASCRRGWRTVPASPKSTTGCGCERRDTFTAFKLLSPWITDDADTDDVETLLSVSQTLKRLVLLNENMSPSSCHETGFRLHVSARSLSCETLVKLCQNFVKYEATLDSIVPSSRRTGSTASDRFFRSNREALGISTIAGDTDTNRGRNDTLASCRNVDALVYLLNPGGKKSFKLNLQNLLLPNNTADNGERARANGNTTTTNNPSIEFRQHSSTVDPVKIRSWVNLCLAMVTNSAKRPSPRALKECRSRKEEFDTFFRHLIRDPLLESYYRRRCAELSNVGGGSGGGGSTGSEQKEKRTRTTSRPGPSGRTKVSVECGCCIESFPASQACRCTENALHTFCRTCVRRCVEEEVFVNYSTVVRCMSMEGCSETSRVREGDLKAALPESLMQKLKEMRYDAKMRADGYRLCECPKCEAKGYVPNNRKTFKCPSDSCKHLSCPLCKESPHPNQTCAQAKDQTKTDARNAVEEAMSNALVRNCPSCSLPSVIGGGCNKMTCPRCRTTWCYLCRVVTDESTSHWSGQSRCALYTQGDQTDRRAVKTAGDQTAGSYSGLEEGRSLVGLVQKLI